MAEDVLSVNLCLSAVEQPAELFSGPNFLQSPLWAKQKGRFGWMGRVYSARWSDSSGAVIHKHTLVVLLRRLPGGLSIGYIPHGPAWSEIQDLITEQTDGFSPGSILDSMFQALRKELPPGCMLLRFDPDWPVDVSAELSRTPGFLKGESDIQPPNTVLVDLSPGEDQILATMKSKHRYNIRLSGRKGVEVVRYMGSAISSDVVSRWYEMYRVTAQRDGITIHSRDYYDHLFSLFATNGFVTNGASAQHHQDSNSPGYLNNPGICLYMATHEDDILAGIVVVFWSDVATYLYGASSNTKRNLMPAYALQWQAMVDAKALGCRSYDLFGVPPEADPDHPMFGLYQFKTGFGGELIRYPGTWDRVIRPLVYRIYRFAEGLRGWLVRVRKQLRN